MNAIPLHFWLYAGTAAFLLGLHVLSVSPRPFSSIGLLAVGVIWLAIFTAKALSH